MGFSFKTHLKKFRILAVFLLFLLIIPPLIYSSYSRSRKWVELDELVFDALYTFEEYKMISLKLYKLDDISLGIGEWRYSRDLFLEKFKNIMNNKFVKNELLNESENEVFAEILSSPSWQDNYVQDKKKLGYILFTNKNMEQKLEIIYRSYLIKKEKNNTDNFNISVILLLSIFILMFFYIIHYFHRKRDDDALSFKQSLSTMEAAVDAMAYQVELKDDSTGKHIERTSYYVELISRELKNDSSLSGYMKDEYIEALTKASVLHDIGKVGIPDKILGKPDRLTPEEFEVIKNHTTLGANTIRRAIQKLDFNSYLDLAVMLIESHHENWDGTGYPKGLKGEEIPLSGRIMALADTYDAMRSKRVYKPTMTHKECRDFIIQQSGKKFDPKIVKAFIAIEEEFENLHSFGEDDGDFSPLPFPTIKGDSSV